MAEPERSRIFGESREQRFVGEQIYAPGEPSARGGETVPQYGFTQAEREVASATRAPTTSLSVA